MSDFTLFRDKVKARFDELTNMVGHLNLDLFTVDISNDTLWEIYLDSFPPGTNEIYRERAYHDCQCCKQFIRSMGGVVAIDSNLNLLSIWDITVNSYYQEVANALDSAIKKAAIKNIFRTTEKVIGTESNWDIESKDKWTHFFARIPNNFVNTTLKNNKKKSDYFNASGVFQRAMEEFSIPAIETILDLIKQNSIYRGDTKVNELQIIKSAIKGYCTCKTEKVKKLFCWQFVTTQPLSISTIRNSAIGTLITDLSTNMDITDAVTRYEVKVAPENYKRSSTIITKQMIKKAEETVVDLGIQNSLARRYAKIDDITINNVLFADRAARQEMGVFDELYAGVVESSKSYDKCTEMSLQDFIEDVLPTATNMEIMLENQHENNLVSLIAPTDLDAPPLFKWNNAFSWSYNGSVTDSIKTRVSKAGGNVSGELRCSLAWSNTDDLDIHVIEPKGNEIYYSDKRNFNTGGTLDVDMNAGSPYVTNAVENITWDNKHKMEEGVYTLCVKNYTQRTMDNIGFNVEIECQSKLFEFNHTAVLRNNITVMIAKFKYTQAKGIELIESIGESATTKNIWNLATQKFHTVKAVMASPNYWDDKTIGNKHYMFMLENCYNPDETRGFYNEFLRDDLHNHRKVFEVLAGKMKVESTEDQLSGIGISTTRAGSFLCKIHGSVSRTLRIVNNGS